MTISIAFSVAVYLAGAWASYIVLKDLRILKKIRISLALGSWFTFIIYLIACCYNDFND